MKETYPLDKIQDSHYAHEWLWDMSQHYRISREGNDIKIESKIGKKPIDLTVTRLSPPPGYYISEVADYYIKFSV